MTKEPINLSVNITYRCNTVCANCNRGIHALDWRHLQDMTLDDAHRLVDGIKRAKQPIHKLRIAGGEPTIHPQLRELAEIFRPICGKLHVATNGMIPKEQLPELPDGGIYKYSDFSDKDHHAMFVSPADLGLERHMKPLTSCVSMLLVGRGSEPEGFMQCALARTIVTALGRDPASIFHDEPVLTQDREICKHCPLSLGTKGNKKLTWHVAAGRIKPPTKSYVAVQTDKKVMHAADAHVRRAEQQGSVTVIGRDGLLPIIERPPGNWDDAF